MSKRHRSSSSSNALVALLQKDQFGSVWLSVLFLSVLILKWYVIDPVTIEGSPCVICVIFLLWLMSIIVALLISAVWWAWTSKAGKGIGLMLVLPAYILGCSFLVDYLLQRIVPKLYHSGMLSWPEADYSFLIDDMVRHGVGLLLATAVVYGMLRLLICHDLEDKKIVIPVGLGIILATSGLLLLGIKLY